MEYERTTTSAARRARAASLSAAPPPKRQRAQRRRSRVTRGSRLGVGGRSWHVAPRARAEGERPLAGAVPSHWHEPTTTSAARRARAASSSAAPPPKRQRAQARALRVARGAGLALEVAAGTSHHGRAPEERGLSPAQCPFEATGRPQPARHGARAQQARVLRLLPRDSERSARAARVTRGAGLALEAAAGTSHHGRAPKREASRRRSVLSYEHEPTTTSAARRARAASSSAAPPPKRQRAPRRLRVRTRQPAWQLEAAAGASHHGAHAEGERPLDRRSALLTGIGRPQPARHGARAQQARVLRLLPRDSEQRATCCVTRGAVLALEAAAGTSHHEARAEGERPLAGAVLLFRARADHNQRGTARASASSSAAPPPQRQRAHAHAPRRGTRRWLGVGGRSWHVAPRARAEGERPLAGAVSFYRHRPPTTSAARRARAASSSAAPPPQRQRAQARRAARGTRRWLGVGGRSLHVAPRRAPKERGLSPAQCRFVVPADHNQRGTARARSKLECCASSQRQRAPGAARA